MSEENYCWEHEIYFPDQKSYLYHRDNECKKFLQQQTVCLFVVDGKCCGMVYKHISSLVLHYKSAHNLYACVHCYKLYEQEAELEQHDHSGRLNVRESEFSNGYVSMEINKLSPQGPISVIDARCHFQRKRKGTSTIYLLISGGQLQGANSKPHFRVRIVVKNIQPSGFWDNT